MLQSATSSTPRCLSYMGTRKVLSIELLSKFTTPYPTSISPDFTVNDSNLTFISNLYPPLSLIATGKLSSLNFYASSMIESVQSPVC